MSKSRLEKFLYALYSLDSSDLPNPLSRIEELYKCLVTGDEAPTFEPLSRVEKYLMAILGIYDVDELPNPISRVEVLLYKLATGDDNLDDVKSFLSEHEELLAEIIRNGGVGGNIDIEYVLYTLSTEFNTLYNTAEKPIKSAILKGNTLVNLATPIEYKPITYHGYCLVFNGSMLKSGEYTLKSSVDFSQYVIDLLSTQKDKPSQYRRITISENGVFTIDDTFFVANTIKTEDFFICLRPIDDPNNGTVTTNEIENCEVILLEGDHTQEDIPYFEGIQSVKMPVLTTTGKNLFDGEWEVGSIHPETGGDVINENSVRTKDFFVVESNKEYTISNNKGYTVTSNFYDYEKNLISTSSAKTFITPSNSYFVKFRTSPSKFENDISIKFQIEQGSISTSYEPFKSNILSTSEEVVLRGIGDVKDTLDCLTGEVTERIKKFDFLATDDGNWYSHKNENGYTSYYITNQALTYKKLGICDKLPICGWTGDAENMNKECVWFNGATSWGVMIKSDKASTKQDFLNYLNDNVELLLISKTESIKTVDLSVVNQDGNNTKLSTFNDITHITLSSEGLIPEAELEVATKNEEDLEDSIVYTTHTLSEEFNTLYNTAEKPIKSAILKGNTGYRDIDTGEILETFEEGRNLELVSVKMPVLTTTGKNLFPTNNFIECGTDNRMIGQYIYEVYLKSGNYRGSFVHADDSDKDTWLRYEMLDEQNNQVLVLGAVDRRFTIENNGLYKLKFSRASSFNNTYTKVKVQIEEGSVATEYEPYKSNILTCNEEVELRGIGDVKDELNVLTGEIIERTSQGILNGTETWTRVSNSDRFYTRVNTLKKSETYNNLIIADKIRVEVGHNYDSFMNSPTNAMTGFTGITSYTNENWIYLKIIGIENVESLKAYLQQNPINYSYVLGEEIIKTVDLSVVDQDGNNTELSMFNDITHVTITSEGLIPEAELEVEEKVTGVDASMLGISREQKAINTATNEQSENVDATMIATTEIYEGLL